MFLSRIYFFSFVMPHTNDTQRRIDLKLIEFVCGLKGFRRDFWAIFLRTQMVTTVV
jgi:hypothetical protein